MSITSHRTLEVLHVQHSINLYLKITMRENWASYVDDYKHNYLLECDTVKYGRHCTDISNQCHNTSSSLQSTTCQKTVIFKHYVACAWIWNTWEIPNLHCGWWRDDVQWWVQYALAWCAPGPLVPDAHSLHPVHCHIQSILYCVCPSGKLRLFEC